MNSSKRRTIKKFQGSLYFIPLILLGLLTGCGGPAVPKSDLMDYLKKVMPPGVELTDVTYEVAPQSGQQAATGIQLNAKISATASEDLFSLPSDPADIKPLNDYVDFYNKYIQWTNALQYTHYADEINQDKPKIDKDLPKFLHRDQTQGTTFSGYCNVVAEHQVDRWVFSLLTDVDWGTKKPSQPMAQFGPNCVGANTPEGQAAVQKFKENESAITQFKKQFAEKHAAESQPLVDALKPWLTSGQEIQGQGIGAVSTRFSFSQYDPATNRFRARQDSVSGDGFLVGDCMVIFQDDRIYDGRVLAPSCINFVGPFDPKTGDITMLWQPTFGSHPENHREILHTLVK